MTLTKDRQKMSVAILLLGAFFITGYFLHDFGYSENSSVVAVAPKRSRDANQLPTMNVTSLLSDGNTSTDSDFSETIYYLHIPKTGGKSMRQTFQWKEAAVCEVD